MSTELILKNQFGEYSVKMNRDVARASDYMEELVVPLLLASSFHLETIHDGMRNYLEENGIYIDVDEDN